MTDETPCFKEFIPFFDQEMVDWFRARGKPIPYILHFIDQVCSHTECKHHIFWDGLRFRSQNGNHQPRHFHETEYSRECCNCMCLINKSATEMEISEMYGIPEDTVHVIEKRALDKMKVAFKERVRNNHRNYIKRVRGESDMTKRARKFESNQNYT